MHCAFASSLFIYFFIYFLEFEKYQYTSLTVVIVVSLASMFLAWIPGLFLRLKAIGHDTLFFRQTSWLYIWCKQLISKLQYC